MYWLHETTETPLPPKADTLARLGQAGLPVPPGFVLTPEEASILVSTPQPPEATILRAEIELYYRNLCERSGDTRVAVRAAGPQEDTEKASFAGQYETRLNVTGGAALMEAIQSCALSGESARLLAYQQTLAPEAHRSPGVIVQAMVHPQVAGVLFTQHPVTGDDRYLLIEAAPALGEAILSGIENPARLTFSRNGQAHTLIATECLPTAFREAEFWQPLLRMALEVERLLGSTQDIEWAYADGQFWLLQARPISTHPLVEPPPDFTLWTRANIGEVLSGVITPLTWSTFIHVIRQAEDPRQSPRPSEMARLFGGRAYMQRQALWDSYANIWGIRPAVVVGRGIGCDVRDDADTLRRHQPTLPLSARFVKSVYVWREVLSRHFVYPKLEKYLEALGPQLVFLSEENTNPMSLGTLRKHLRATLVVTRQAFQVHMQASFFAFCSYAAVWQTLESVMSAQEADQWMATFRVPPRDKGLWDTHMTALASRVHENPILNEYFRTLNGEALYQTLQASLEGKSFLAEVRRRALQMGNRAPQEFELHSPRWAEDPRTLISAIQARLLSAGHPTQPIPRRLRGSHVFNPTKRMNPVQRWLFLRKRESYTAYTRMRERTKGLLMACFTELRRITKAAGQRLYERGYLNQPDDVFFLTLDELDSLCVGEYDHNLPDYVVQRKRTHDYHEKHLPAIPIVENKGDTLRGTAVSSGRVTGRARVVRRPQEAALRPGEILITEATDPGWLPLFITAGGIVTEIGGLLSHTATLARELGKPAVFAVPGITRRIHDGQQITVDGWEGTITIHEP